MGKGRGSVIYRSWEENLPKDVTIVKLWAAGDGTGDASRFWKAMGFAFEYTGDDLDYDDSRYMHKGVNGIRRQTRRRNRRPHSHRPKQNG